MSKINQFFLSLPDQIHSNLDDLERRRARKRAEIRRLKDKMEKQCERIRKLTSELKASEHHLNDVAKELDSIEREISTMEERRMDHE